MQRVLDAIRAEADIDPHELADEQILDDLEAVMEARRRLDARAIALLQVADVRQIAAEQRGRATRNWLIEDQRLAAADAGRLVRLARALPFRPQLADALASGELSVDHAAPILNTVKKLMPSERDVDEKILIEAARDLDPDLVRQLCHKTLEASCATESADERRERVYGSRYLKLSDTFDGMVKLDAMLTPEQGAVVSAVIEPLAQKQGAEDDRTAPQRRADALQAVAEATLGYSDQLPEFNGEPPHINAVVDYDKLIDQLHDRADTLPALDGSFTVNGIDVGPDTARLLACDAKILPVVMRGQTEVLDIGRATREWPKAIRKALQLEDKGCGWPKCKMPLWACRIHHLDYWSLGGQTSKANGVHLCPFHHWLVHHMKWRIWRDRSGKIQIERIVPPAPWDIDSPIRQ